MLVAEVALHLRGRRTWAGSGDHVRLAQRFPLLARPLPAFVAVPPVKDAARISLDVFRLLLMMKGKPAALENLEELIPVS